MKHPITAVLLALLAFPSMSAADQGSVAAGKTVFVNLSAVYQREDASGETPMAKSLNVPHVPKNRICESV
jgi:hypothetical protein